MTRRWVLTNLDWKDPDHRLVQSKGHLGEAEIHTSSLLPLTSIFQQQTTFLQGEEVMFFTFYAANNSSEFQCQFLFMFGILNILEYFLGRKSLEIFNIIIPRIMEEVECLKRNCCYGRLFNFDVCFPHSCERL